jgi:predicted nucleic acid-binding protein
VTLVIDASVALKWVVPEILSAHADRILAGEHDLAAPDLLATEAANALWKKTLRSEISARDAREALDLLLHGGLTWHGTPGLLPRALDLARLSRHPVYDCVYLALAERLGAPLVTADASLLKVAAARRIEARSLTAL